MKKVLFILPLIFGLFILPVTKVYASDTIPEYTNSDYPYALIYHSYEYSQDYYYLVVSQTPMTVYVDNQGYLEYNSSRGFQSTDLMIVVRQYLIGNFVNIQSNTDYEDLDFLIDYTGNNNLQITGDNIYPSTDDFNNRGAPPEPEIGSTWLSDMWDWILWQLGFNDDYSGDLVKIIGGDKVNTEIVTPTPSPTSSPTPSPTPFALDIVDNNGNPVYTITGIPNQTIIINQGDDIDNGSDFDIFEVDQIIGEGGSVSPRDGINDVMETNNDYIQDMDISSVQNSFSVLPADWLLMIGVLASLPFIAGFIAKLLK